MGKYGRTRRHRAYKKRQGTSSTPPEENHLSNQCSEYSLRKWMVTKASRRQLKDTLRLVPFCFHDTGRGLKTKRPIPPGTAIVSVPQCLLITLTCVFNSDLGPHLKVWTQRFTSHQLLTLFLIFELSKGSNSEWHPFIKSLPVEYTMPQYFSHEEICLLVPHISQQAETCAHRTHQAHKEVFAFCQTNWPDAANFASWEKFRWAWCAVGSRCVYLDTEACVLDWVNMEQPDENYMALCPYLDLLNHTSTAKVQAGFNKQNNCYEIVTLDTYHAHDQVFINYGPHDNTTLFLVYGFTLPHNIHNAVCFSVEDLQELRGPFNITMWDHKIDILRRNKLCRELTCTMEGVSWNLKTSLTILAMDWSQLKEVHKVLGGEAVSTDLEEKVRLIAHQLINGVLVKRKQFLADKFSTGEASPHQQLAHSLLLDEINILSAALQDVT
ncbi:hypothetical protein BaRGS_00015609 [Batillaria attramentaria]|uniref:SET domain-containing protein n=1 Tax=Batillaria attramentaria TaxID=370345 RepID=A0ABD0L0P3_9CAEN